MDWRKYLHTSVHFLYRNGWWRDSGSGSGDMHICCDKIYEGI